MLFPGLNFLWRFLWPWCIDLALVQNTISIKSFPVRFSSSFDASIVSQLEFNNPEYFGRFGFWFMIIVFRFRMSNTDICFRDHNSSISLYLVINLFISHVRFFCTFQVVMINMPHQEHITNFRKLLWLQKLQNKTIEIHIFSTNFNHIVVGRYTIGWM